MLDELIGRRFGGLKVLKESDEIDTVKLYLVRCDCGEIFTMDKWTLERGIVNQCFECLLGNKSAWTVNKTGNA
ncbi:hypothetical protein M0R72_16435 [Candidatus Pacearchaeota archaeon]|nr:hypothetical protein [Candidatus Pacearchaeota archaeon]